MNKSKLTTSLIILIIDQIIKYIIQSYDVKYVIIKNILSIDYCTNTGAAFSILKDKTIGLIVVSIVVLILVYNLSFSYKDTKLSNLGFGLLYGGIVSNLIDRIFYSYVRDFISIGNFPVFNIADACIVIGLIIILIITFKSEWKEKKEIKGSDSSEDNSRRGNKSKNR